ncbi:hypothetical protein WHR41_04589 [Cladosporium halotolerans]|uniref:Prion-inhibition and propagation HeLo domain-containing protein n=1 Tax=Cladosporium halotolerans TaxID=1052096 RepID=A0AB34KSZ4_9PEZI
MPSKATAEHNEGSPPPKPEHEALLPGVMALANLFSNTVEAFGLIRASQRWEREEQLLLVRLGIQQARLLIWGDILGVSSPPPSVTNRAVPKHPSAAYPDLKEPTFFAARDARLDAPDTRTAVEDALSTIVDRSAHTSREEMMEKFGLKPPKRFTPDFQPALDTTRLEAFREKYELLKEVAESYARINSRRTNSIVMQSWVISDRAKFASFIRLTQDRIDFLVNSMGVGDRVDRAMRMDIRNFGWHLTADRARVAQDVSKLKLIQDACRDDYPQYIVATQQALDNISRESRESSGLGGSFSYNPYAAPTSTPPKSSSAEHKKPATTTTTAPNGSSPTPKQNGTTSPAKRPFLGSIFKSFRSKSSHAIPKSSHSKTTPSTTTTPQSSPPPSQPASPPTIDPTPDPDRSLSDAGPHTGASGSGSGLSPPSSSDGLERVRSRSLDAGPAPAPLVPSTSLDERLARLETRDAGDEAAGLEKMETVRSMISRHDMYRA